MSKKTKNYGLLVRRESDNKQTLGHLTLFDTDVDVLMTCYILELDNDGNKRRESRINAGIYNVVLRVSEKYGTHYHLTNVFNRELILIHVGNYHTDILGCLIPGSALADINKDGYRDVVNSGKTMKKLLALAGKEWELEIIDRD